MPHRGLHRSSKAERLAARGDVRRLVRLLGTHDWLVDADGQARDLAVGRRLEVVAALGTMKRGDAEDGLVLALGDDDPRVRQSAVMALRADASDKAAKALARAAASWRDPGLAQARAAAVEALVAMDDEVLAVVFAETLVDDPQREQLSSDEEAELRRLFDVEQGRATEVLAERLALRLSAPNRGERGRALQVIVTLGGVAVEALVDALADTERRQAACAALAAIRDTRAVAALVSMLDSGDAAARAMAARTLGAIRDPRAVEALVRAGNDEDPDVRDAALDAVDRLGSVVDLLSAAALADSMRARPGNSDADRAPPQPHGVDASAEPFRALLQRLLGKPRP
jgi:HEAT repeat protein